MLVWLPVSPEPALHRNVNATSSGSLFGIRVLIEASQGGHFDQPEYNEEKTMDAKNILARLWPTAEQEQTTLAHLEAMGCEVVDTGGCWAIRTPTLEIREKFLNQARFTPRHCWGAWQVAYHEFHYLLMDPTEASE